MVNARAESARRRWRLATPATALVVAFAFGLAAHGGTTASSGVAAAPSRQATIDPVLVEKLQSARSASAIVTTWTRGELDQVARVVDGTRLRVLPMILTKSLTKTQLEKLRTLRSVRSVFANTPVELYMEDSTWITRARYVWPSSTPRGGLQGLGVTGRGVELAVIDTGIDGMHEDSDNLIEFCETQQALSGDRTTVLCSPFRPGSGNAGPAGPTNRARTDAHDQDVSHGSHVSGTIAGTGHASGGTAFRHSTIGMAPHAKLRVYSANVASALLPHEIMASYDDMIYKKIHGLNNVVAVNNSWGGSGGSNYDPNNPQHVAFNRAFDAGILSVFSAGNSGPEHNTLGLQCVNPRVVCVAANTKPDQIVAFSSRGRPSQPSDTNRDGTAGGPGDIPPDNHDWRLGQALELGRYRPTLTAPGVNINSIKAIGLNIGDPTAATCREDDLIDDDIPNLNCYVQASGTSMSAPHVTGAVGLIAQAYRQGHGGRSPTPNQLIDILERSANTSKLPGWDAEEQGAGRLDAYEAVKFARSYPNGLRRPNLGYPTPPYVEGQYPGAAAITQTFKGCTGTASWTARSVEVGEPEVGQPPLATQRYGQHFITVPEKVDRIRVTVTWPRHGTANLYARLWRPGVNPDAESATPDRPGRTPAFHQTRVWPDQEGTGLPTGLPPTSRLVEIRAPEETDHPGDPNAAPPTIPSGKWILRVYHRVGGAPMACGPTQETPQILERVAYQYDVKVELPKVTHRPTVTIDSPAAGATIRSRFVQIKGSAGYPPPDAPQPGNVGHSWEGVTNWEVPQSEGGQAVPDPDTRTVLYFHGNAEEGCTGDGRTDLLACNGPFLMPKSQLSLSAAASWKTALQENIFLGGNDRTVFDPSWSWCLMRPGLGCPADPTYTPPGPRTVRGPMTVEWWAACVACDEQLGFAADWRIRIWADGVLKFERRVTAAPDTPNVAERVEATVNLPTISANQRLTLHIDPVFIDAQSQTTQYYDSENPCQPGLTTGRCDSLVRMPVIAAAAAAPDGPRNVRVTDLPADAPYPAAPQTPALRVAWDRLPDAVRYEVYRSTDPAFTPSTGNRVHSGPGTACVSPQAPNPGDPPGHDRSGLCYTDMGVSLRTTYYYRVAAVLSTGTRTLSSLLAYGTPTRYDRQVRVKVDRLYGPQYWEYALLPPSPNPTLDDAGTQWTFLWDTVELFAGPHNVFARSHTQGIGSTKAFRSFVLDEDRDGDNGGGGGGPGCPDDDDGDRDDDEEDGDLDDDGDDGDDDCEDDDDDEEDEDD